MPQVGAALSASRLSPNHAVGGVLVLLNLILVGRLEKARPARARIEFCRGIKQRFPAANAVVRPRILGLPVLAGKSRLRPGLAGHVILLWRKFLLPLRLVLYHF